jgi:hypothetical protein
MSSLGYNICGAATPCIAGGAFANKAQGRWPGDAQIGNKVLKEHRREESDGIRAFHG